LFGGALVLLLFSYRESVRWQVLADWLAPSVILGQIIGRLGNLFNYEAFGYPTNLPWKMFVPAAFRPESFAASSYFHPLFLYEMLGNAVALWVLLKFAKTGPKSGRLLYLYIILYTFLRFLLEFLRVDSTFLWGGLRLNSLMSAALFLAGVTAWIFYARKAQASKT
jgi:phosphatidylglycerol:prolipoprotein diacylglycerol transferase